MIVSSLHVKRLQHICGLPRYDLRHSTLKTQRCHCFCKACFAYNDQIVSTGTKATFEIVNVCILLFSYTDQVSREALFPANINCVPTLITTFLQVLFVCHLKMLQKPFSIKSRLLRSDAYLVIIRPLRQFVSFH